MSSIGQLPTNTCIRCTEKPTQAQKIDAGGMAQNPTSRPERDTTKSPNTPVTVPGPYEQYVRSLVLQWPHLRIIKDFMSMDLKHTPTPFQSRIFKTNVRVIDVTTEPSLTHPVSTSMKEYRFEEIGELEKFLNEPRPNSITTRLFLVEDLSAKVIEALGNTFALDPEFFAQHLNAWWRHYKGYWTPYSSKAGHAPHPLLSSILKQNFQHFQFRRAYHWPGKGVMDAMRCDHSNLWRPYIPRGIYGADAFLEEMMTTISFGAEDLWTGIYLFDPVLPIPPPLLYRGIRNFRERPKYISKSGNSKMPEVLVCPVIEEFATEELQEPQDHLHSWTSLRDETANHILKMSSHQPQHTEANIQSLPAPPIISGGNYTGIKSAAPPHMPHHPPPAPPMPAAVLKYKAIHNFQGNAANELSLVKDEVVIVTKKGDSGWWLIKKMDSIEEGWVPSAYLENPSNSSISIWSLSNRAPLELSLRTILSNWALVADILNRRIYHLEDQVAGDIWGGIATQSDLLIQSLKLRKHAIRFRDSLECTVFVLENYFKDTLYGKELKQDALDLASSLSEMVSRGESNIPTFLAKSSVEEAQKTFAQAETMKRLTMLAFVFVPINSITAVLGIQDSKPWIKYWIFAGLSIPILILIFSLSGEFRELRFAYLKWSQKKFTLHGGNGEKDSEIE